MRWAWCWRTRRRTTRSGRRTRSHRSRLDQCHRRTSSGTREPQRATPRRRGPTERSRQNTEPHVALPPSVAISGRSSRPPSSTSPRGTNLSKIVGPRLLYNRLPAAARAEPVHRAAGSLTPSSGATSSDGMSRCGSTVTPLAPKGGWCHETGGTSQHLSQLHDKPGARSSRPSQIGKLRASANRDARDARARDSTADARRIWGPSSDAYAWYSTG